MAIPAKLQEFLDTLDLVPERTDRIQYLISMADQFKPVSDSVARKPFPESARVPGCESEAFIFATPNPDGALAFHFGVENPQGVSAMALAVILERFVSGAPSKEIAEIPEEIVYRIFGNELSMGKSLGLMNMVRQVKWLAQTTDRTGKPS